MQYFKRSGSPEQLVRVYTTSVNADLLTADGWVSSPGFARIVYDGDNLDWDELSAEQAAAYAKQLGFDFAA